jgi:hypothetical protein
MSTIKLKHSEFPNSFRHSLKTHGLPLKQSKTHFPKHCYRLRRLQIDIIFHQQKIAQKSSTLSRISIETFQRLSHSTIQGNSLTNKKKLGKKLKFIGLFIIV